MEAHKMTNQATGGSSSLDMRALLTSVERSIVEYVERREFHLTSAIVKYITCRFREELEARYRCFYLEHPHTSRNMCFV
jgi:hypothetical protein